MCISSRGFGAPPNIAWGSYTPFTRHLWFDFVRYKKLQPWNQWCHHFMALLSFCFLLLDLLLWRNQFCPILLWVQLEDMEQISSGLHQYPLRMVNDLYDLRWLKIRGQSEAFILVKYCTFRKKSIDNGLPSKWIEILEFTIHPNTLFNFLWKT